MKRLLVAWRNPKAPEHSEGIIRPLPEGTARYRVWIRGNVVVNEVVTSIYTRCEYNVRQAIKVQSTNIELVSS